MPNAKDLEVNSSNFSIALIGPYGSGKSSFCKTAPTPGFLLNTGSEEQSYRGTDFDYVKISNQSTGWNEIINTMNELVSKKPSKVPMLDDPTKEYKTYVLDNATALLDCALQRAMMMNKERSESGGPVWNIHYGMQYNLAEGILRKFLELPGHRIVCFHNEVWHDEETGKTHSDLLWGGKGTNKIPGFFDEVLYCTPKTVAKGEIKYFIQTQSKGQNKARSRISGVEKLLPFLIPNEWAYLVGDKKYVEDKK